MTLQKIAAVLAGLIGFVAPISAQEVECQARGTDRTELVAYDAQSSLLLTTFYDVLVTPQTSLFGISDLGGLSTGTPLLLELCLDNQETSGTATALSITISSDPSPSTEYFSGRITAVDVASGTFTLDGQDEILVAETTAIYGVGENQTPTLSDFSLGGIAFTLTTDFGQGFVADYVYYVEESSVPFSYEGTLESASETSSTLTVGHYQVLVTPETRILDQTGTSTSVDTFSLGDTLLVEGSQDILTYEVTADSIRKGQEFPRFFPLYATTTVLDNITTQSLLITSNYTVSYDGEAVYQTLTGESLSGTEIPIGDIVEVFGLYSIDDQTLRAQQIRQVESTFFNQPFVQIGLIKELDLAAGTLTVEDKQYALSESLQLTDAIGAALESSEFAVGDFVLVAGIRDLRDNAESVARISDLREGTEIEQIASSGYISWVDPFSRTISISLADEMGVIVGYTTAVYTSETEFQEASGDPLSPENLTAGELVEIRGELSVSAAVVAARSVRRLEGPAFSAPYSFSVFADGFSEDGIVLFGSVWPIDDNAVITGYDGETTTTAAIKSGTFITVDGTRTINTFTAEKIALRYATVEFVDPATPLVVASGTAFFPTPETQVVGIDGTAIALTDLALGDQILIEGARDNSFLFVPTRIQQKALTARQSDDLPQFVEPIVDFGSGTVSVIVQDGTNTYGSVGFPRTSYDAAPDTIYEVTATLAGDQGESELLPAVRLRTNLDSFELATEYLLEARGDLTLVPTQKAQTFRFFTQGLENGSEGSDAWFPSLDVLSFNNTVPQGSTINFQSVNVRPIAANRITVNEKLLDTTELSGWEFGSAPIYTPAASRLVGGKPGLRAVDEQTFGLWTANTGIELQPSTIYRARMTVSTEIADPLRIPTVRLRLNSSNFQLASLVQVESVAEAHASPDHAGREYMVLMETPATLTGGQTLLVSFDLFNFVEGNNTTDFTTLDRVIVETVRVPE